MKLYLAIGGLAALLALPGALAYVSSADFTGPFAAIVPPEAGGDAFAQAFPIYYVNDDGTVWQESNGIAGLQTSPIIDEVTGEQIAAADTIVSPALGVPAMPEMPALPPL